MKIKGTIEHIIFHNNENGYTVLSVRSGLDTFSVSGKFPIVGIGETLELEGEFKVNPKYGEQFEASSVAIVKPTSKEAIIKYLSSGLIRGIGEITARHIVDRFGEETLKIIENEPDKLAFVRGISIAKTIEIHSTYEKIKKMQDAVMFLQKYDISINMSIKIYDKYKQRTEEVLGTNPYKLIEDIDGIGFKIADKIAEKIGIKKDSELRIKAGILFAFSELAEKQGSTVALLDELKNAVKLILELDDRFNEKIDEAIFDLEISGTVKKVIFNDSEALAYSKYYSMEDYIAKRMMAFGAEGGTENYGTEKDIEQFEMLNNISLASKQKEAILVGTSENVAVITGGPGTGKTTIIKAILQIFKNAKLRCMLMAPTGRAAKRLEEQTGEPASTIHRALESNFQGTGRGFARNANNPLETDVVIVDEVSMLDVFLMSSLLKAMPAGAKLILVGDKDQLPSVGAGNVLADIIASGQVKVVELDQIFRQSEDSMIAINAHKINNSEMIDLSQKSNDFFYSGASEQAEMAKKVVSLMADKIPSNFPDLTTDDVQIIAPMKVGQAGVNNLNILLQATLNPKRADDEEITLNKRTFRLGDRVMQIVNNYDRDWRKTQSNGQYTYGSGVFNGDMGKICMVDTQISEIYVEFDDGRMTTYSFAELDEIVLSYAITIHKSQGSEFPVVIIPITGGSPLLMNKNLLYTAVTRAKKMVFLVGKSSNIYYMIKNQLSAKRSTMLKSLIESYSNGINL